MKDFWYYWGPVVIVVLLGVSILVGCIFIDKATCNAKTIDIGFDHRWSIMGGCQIEVADGQWIPLESYYFKQE